MRYLFVSIVFLLFSNSVLVAQEQKLKNDSSMNSKILGLRTCGYIVPDLESAKMWYSKAFGLDPYFDEPFYVGFNIGGYELGLMPKENDDQKRGDNILIYWGVEDVEEVYQHFIKLDAKEHEAPHNVGGDIVVASVKDPWDNLIGFIYNPAFKAE